ncbi:hypothetical protein BDY21DRAFT_93357 [Lineolata rhizophorae]|uniref:Uncharacterized protein n=1 Tax=Lineolata rhizophorae TaxID=578093 RepID=A0A6A6PCL6_9PEZI|nr:hypothetical protein BDY21DRAFT_93357 [Lineolata rhizophorae]
MPCQAIFALLERNCQRLCTVDSSGAFRPHQPHPAETDKTAPLHHVYVLHLRRMPRRMPRSSINAIQSTNSTAASPDDSVFLPSPSSRLSPRTAKAATYGQECPPWAANKPSTKRTSRETFRSLMLPSRMPVMRKRGAFSFSIYPDHAQQFLSEKKKKGNKIPKWKGRKKIKKGSRVGMKKETSDNK